MALHEDLGIWRGSKQILEASDHVWDALDAQTVVVECIFKATFCRHDWADGWMIGCDSVDNVFMCERVLFVSIVIEN